MVFRKIGVSEHIIRVLDEERFEKPTEIQEKSIPLILEGKDVIASSATGSGKTLAFGSNIIHHCAHGKGIQALILAPTRELAEQISSALKKFSKYKALYITSVYGGVGITPQFLELKKADIVIGTPGRLLDHLERGSINLQNVKTLVLDEADRMLDMGFKIDVEKIIRQCPENRQTLLFSATIPPEIATLAHRYMKNPIKVSAASRVDPKKMAQVYYNVESNKKFSLLVHLLKHEHSTLVMIFCNTRQSVDFVANNLRANDVFATAIHGGFSQDKRNRTMSSFNSKKTNILVCTDVAARGLDIKEVSHVYNFDIPNDPKEYIHRIGRTARAGHEGKIINLLSDRDYDNFSRVLRDVTNIKKENVPEFARAIVSWTARPERRFGSRSNNQRNWRRR